MYLLVDVLICLWLIGGIIVGAKKGFVEYFFKLISTVLALFVAIILADQLLGWTDGLFGLSEKIGESFSEKFAAGGEMNKYILSSSQLEELGLPEALTKLLVSYYEKGYGGQNVMFNPPTAAMVLGGAIGHLLALVIAGLVIFIIVKIWLRMIRKSMTELVEKVAAIRVLNSILGTVLGALQTLITIWFYLYLISLLPVTGINTFIANCTVLGAIADHNILMSLIAAIL